MAGNEQKHYAIGIDSGTKTGVAVYDKQTKKLVQCSTMPIHKAMKIVEEHREHKIIVVVEDARKAVFGRSNDAHKAQGAGSVKRDAAIWDAFLKDLGVEYRMVRPNKRATKIGKYEFEKITKYTGMTSEHGRDAAMLVYGL